MYLKASSASFRGDMLGASTKLGFMSIGPRSESIDYSKSFSAEQVGRDQYGPQRSIPAAMSTDSSLKPSGPGNSLPVIESRDASHESLLAEVSGGKPSPTPAAASASAAAANNVQRNGDGDGRKLGRVGSVNGGIGPKRTSEYSAASTINSQQPSYDTADVELSNNLIRNDSALASYDAVYDAGTQCIDGATHQIMHRDDEDFSAKIPTAAAMPPPAEATTAASMGEAFSMEQKSESMKDKGAAAVKLPEPPEK